MVPTLITRTFPFFEKIWDERGAGQSGCSPVWSSHAGEAHNKVQKLQSSSGFLSRDATTLSPQMSWEPGPHSPFSVSYCPSPQYWILLRVRAVDFTLGSKGGFQNLEFYKEKYPLWPHSNLVYTLQRCFWSPIQMNSQWKIIPNCGEDEKKSPKCCYSGTEKYGVIESRWQK